MVSMHDRERAPGLRARADLANRTCGSSQWNALAETTVSNGMSGRGQSSKALTSTRTLEYGERLARAMLARLAASSTATSSPPTLARGTLSRPVPQPISRTPVPARMPAP